MNGANPAVRVRVSFRSAMVMVGALFLAVLVLAMLASSQRVIGWMLMAAALAGLLYPVLGWLDARLPRALAVVIVLVGLLGGTGLAVYALVDDISNETERLQEIAPRRAREVERSERFGDTARELDLSRRTEDFVDAIPERLRGGSAAEAVRSATTRGLAFVATAVLTIFILLQGKRFKESAIAQIRDPDRRALAARVVPRVYWRAFGYARWTLVRSLATFAFAYLVARAAGVPGPVALGAWAALWNVIPLFGFFIGTSPIVVFAAFDSGTTAVVLGLAFLAYEIAENLVFTRWVERRTMHLGRFLTVFGAFAGLELYGLGGALLAVLALAGMVATIEELAPA